MTSSPLTPASAVSGQLHCHYFDAGRCRSCTFIEMPYEQQISDKEAWGREVLAVHAPTIWLPAEAGSDRDFRNRAKLAVGGSAGGVTLGILDQDFHGVDLRECGIQAPQIRAVIPVIAGFLDASGLEPYDVRARRGELKFVHITAAPSGDLMIRFVVRTQHGLDVLRSRRDAFIGLVPRATVVSVNLLPEHKAVLEGSREVVLAGDSLRMNLDRVDLHLRPQSFFQTNTAVAVSLYNQVATWVDEISPATLWDLYCGVGGFALYCAGALDSEQSVGRPAGGGSAARSVIGVELSEQAIESARISAAELGLRSQPHADSQPGVGSRPSAGPRPGPDPQPGGDVEFLADDAMEFAEVNLASGQRPDCVIVNPPRRGIGARLSAALEESGIEHIVYSSCNPLTLVKDLDRMPSYQVAQAKVFDMFPHTKHLEVAVVLRRHR
ncbi:methyltransferase domain-containing protein [Brevibacterium marinum]|uniref:23S rRNA (Uracil747-C5)-methyltransferase n=1 Tax=Brevibacterium marinum TaxID=418643 RepID=A0A846RW85_9MICO|nr:methyltransferase domain-containing protein [Brevibacterium marinum]NJC55158.1 23S rRNA (uracil747-C5)-methyltransferase [Brevibacterium marinum]